MADRIAGNAATNTYALDTPLLFFEYFAARRWRLGQGAMGTTNQPRDPLDGTAYRVVRKIGQGGVGVVFEAEHIALKKPCCVKPLRARMLEGETVPERFLLEAQALAKLDHPNIVQVTDFGEIRGQLFFVMERLVGQPLSALLKRKEAPPESPPPQKTAAPPEGSAPSPNKPPPPREPAAPGASSSGGALIY